VNCSLTRAELEAHLASLTARRDAITGDSKARQQTREHLTGSINRAAHLLATADFTEDRRMTHEARAAKARRRYFAMCSCGWATPGGMSKAAAAAAAEEHEKQANEEEG
jgi:hypothetical protein